MESDREDDEDGEPEPCSAAARALGCTCTVWNNHIDPPAARVDKFCPVHGIDPDAEYERRRDEKEDR